MFSIIIVQSCMFNRMWYAFTWAMSPAHCDRRQWATFQSCVWIPSWEFKVVVVLVLLAWKVTCKRWEKNPLPLGLLFPGECESNWLTGRSGLVAQKNQHTSWSSTSATCCHIGGCCLICVLVHQEWTNAFFDWALPPVAAKFMQSSLCSDQSTYRSKAIANAGLAGLPRWSCAWSVRYT